MAVAPSVGSALLVIGTAERMVRKGAKKETKMFCNS